jgi:hypothetical protein
MLTACPQGQWEWEMAKVTGKGLRAILSSPWYLNYINYGTDWTKYYLAEPLDFYGGDPQKALVIGNPTPVAEGDFALTTYTQAESVQSGASLSTLST